MDGRMKPYSESLCTKCTQYRQEANEVARSERESSPYYVSDEFVPGSLQVHSCGVCRIIYEIIQEIGLQSPEIKWEIHVSKAEESESRLDIYLVSGGRNPAVVATIFCSSRQTCPWGMFSEKPPNEISVDTQSSPGSFHYVSEWLQKCISGHAGICSNEADGPLPHRVVYVGTDSKAIRLVQDHNKAGRYMCLSHCWGGKQVLQTNKQNLRTHLTSISWAHIPKTFRDAIQVCWELGVRFLWIDSLCIVQDNLDDWERESKLMCDIYENSYLTIAATSALDASGGLYLRDERHPRLLSGTTTSGTPFQVGFTNPYHSGMELIGFSDEDYEHLPLLKRAWVLQERLISPRVVHFCQTELIWECRTETLCECGEVYNLRKQKHFETLCSPDKTNVILQWQLLIEMYSSLSMSFESDKLPALSGLAKQITRIKEGAQYLAGLWSDALETDLLWYNPDETHDISPKLWRAPSWSWVSRDFRVVFPFSSYYDASTLGLWSCQGEVVRTYFKLITAHTQNSTNDPTGQVKSGSITLSGTIFDVAIEEYSTEFYKYLGLVFNRSGYKMQEEVDDRDIVHFDIRRQELENFARCPQENEIKCLRLTRGKRRNESRPQGEGEVMIEECDYALVLLKNKSLPLYHRIGVAETRRKVEEQEYAQNPENMWLEKPSCFEIGGIEGIVTIV